MIVELHQLLAVLHGEDAHRFVRAAHGDTLRVRRERQAVERINRSLDRANQPIGRRVPKLNLAKERGRSAGNTQQFSVRRIHDGLDARRFAEQPRDDVRAADFVNEHFVITGDGELPAIRRKGQRGDDRRADINRRLGELERVGVGRRIILRTFQNPAREERDLRLRERVAFLRHRRFFTGDFINDQAVLEVARLEARAVFAALGESGVRGDVEFALQLAGVMAAGATALEHRHEVTVVAHGFISGLGRQRRGTEQGKNASQRVHFH